MFKEIKDLEINNKMKVAELVRQFKDSGYQAQNIGIAAEILSEAKKNKAFTFLSFTSNMAASGLRGIFIDLVKRKKIDVIVTTSGTIDEDIIRSTMPYLQGSFESNDEELGKKGVNRMGNIFVPNDRYEYLEKTATKIIEDIYNSKKELTTTELLEEAGKRVSDNSVLHWAAKNKIPIFCPGITDGAFGMQLAFFQQKHPDFKIDVVKDFSKIIELGMAAEKTLGIVLGGGIAKHHTIISNILKGLDYAVYINSSSPYHGSLSGATTSEAKSWGKVKENSKAVTIYGDASIVFPLLTASVEEFFS
ncbi:deoxyhypusine synthase [Candidatus Woesearchaeota archaeon]|nr:deoxyhypusine synthase [Candidatus Woesearchaeota archaeon]|tara:strand:- start:22282 stop:23196 length:915 start_codon:yes stop_codon:yes gene_type:complete